MTTFTRKVLPWAVKADTNSATKPDLGVNTSGVLQLPTPVGTGTTPAAYTVPLGVPFVGANGTTYWLAVLTAAPT